jgi:uncharacterized protein (TIRG00374 family)
LSFSYYLRASRWQILLRSQVVLPSLTVFWATCIGYLANNVLPARAGEIIRSVTIARAAASSISFVLATALTERVMDAGALVVIGLVAPLGVGGLPVWFTHTIQAAAVAALAGAGILVLAPRLERMPWFVLARVPVRLGPRMRERLVALWHNFLLGISALQRGYNLISFLAFTLLIWLIDALVAIVVAHSLALSLTLPQALILLVALGLSSAAPSTPGYLGIYQFVAVTVLMPFAYTREQAIAFIAVFQAETYLTVIVWGLLGLWLLRRRGVRISRERQVDPAGAESEVA